MTSFLCRKKVLEEVNGFDESIDYGEDGDLPTRAREAGFEGGAIGAKIHYRFVRSFRDVFHQGRWYGKTMLNYLRKYPEEFPTLIMLGFFITWPFVTFLSIFISQISFLALLQNLMVFLYVLIGFYRTKSVYIILVPFVKFVRYSGELVGMVESFWSSDRGRD